MADFFGLSLTLPLFLVQESNSSHHDEKHGYATDAPPLEQDHVQDLEVGKWLARENGEEVETKEDNVVMQRVKAALHSRQAKWARDFGLILLLLGWWIPAIINDSPQVRHRWISSTIIVSDKTLDIRG